MYRLIFLVLLLGAVIFSHGQGFNKRYKINLPSALGSAIVEKDNKFYTVSLVSDSIPNFRACISFNSFDDTGKVLVSKIFRVTGAYSVEPRNNLIQTNDNGFANAGYIYRDTINKDEALLTKYDSTGEVVWYKTFGSGVANSQFFVFQDLIQTDDMGFLAVGSVQRNTFRGSIVVLKTDSLGNEQWRKFYNHQYWSLTGTGIYKSDSGYIVTGLDDNYPLGTLEDKVYPYMMEIDTAGNVLWKWFYTANDKTAVTYTGIRADDGGYILSGYKIVGQQSGGGDTYKKLLVMKIDSNKNVLWQQTVGNFTDKDSFTYERMGKAVLDSMGNITVCGTTKFIRGGTFYENAGFVTKLNTSGVIKWSKYYYLTNDTIPVAVGWNEFNGIVANTDRGYTLVGETTDGFNGGAGQQLWLVRVDSNGCVQENYCSGSKPVGIEDIRLPPIEAKVYPNPASNRLNIDYVLPDGKTEGMVELYDVHGRVVKKVQVMSAIGKEEINISDWENGIYHYRFICVHCNTLSGKVVIIK